MNRHSLEFLAARLGRVQHPSWAAAASEVRRALARADRFERPDAEQALCHVIWGHLDNASEEAGGDVAELDALRAEMAGRVYMARSALGWVQRAPGAPVPPPSLADLGL